jgi:transposase InsO family protein
MNVHGNAKLGPSGRRALVAVVADGASLREAAGRFGVSPATAHRWWTRWQQASEPQRSSLACLCDRSSRPRRSPRLLSAVEQERICAERRQTGWGPRLIAGRVGHPHQTVWKVLRRHGLSRPERSPRQAARRYEWPCPGDLLHMDTKQYARFLRPGHAVTGDRTRTTAERNAGWGYEYAHTIVDDHSRLAYTELHCDQQATTVTGFVARALAWYAAHGVTARRLMTDNAWAYTKNRSLARLLADHGVRHLLIPPRRPQVNGKVERFHQTMSREWAYGVTYQDHHARAEALPYWLDHYNQRRPHSSLGGQPPISRVHNLCRHDS